MGVADAPWRCSQCGTVNEPNANACRSCGRWPSLFELEEGTLDESPTRYGEQPHAAEQTFPREVAVPEVAAPVEFGEPVEMEPDYSGAPEDQEWRGPEDPLSRPMQGWPKIGSWIVPIIFLIYVVISIIANR